MEDQTQRPEQAEMDGATAAFVRAFIRDNLWTFAKTMPTIPHEYAVRGRSASGEDFTRFVRIIHSHGTRRRWGKYNNIYLHVDGYNFWTIGNDPAEKETIINRQPEADFYKGMPQCL